MTSFLTDLQLSVRSLRRRPRYALLAVLYLALGVGANIVIFSIFKSVLLDPLPYADPERLVFVYDQISHHDTTLREAAVAPWTFLERRSRVDSLAHLVAIREQILPVGDRNGRPMRCAAVTADFFPALGIEVWRGRSILPDEDRPGGDRVVILSHDFWRDDLGASEGAIGSSLSINGFEHTIIGILPAGFHDPISSAKLWLPLQLDPADSSLAQRTGNGFHTIGRLAPGASEEQLLADLEQVSEQLGQEFPDTHKRISAQVYPLREHISGDIEPQLWALQLAAFFVLLIACANLSSLLLLRASEQSREMAARAAFGATRLQIARRWFSEGLLIASAAGVLGLALAAGLLRLLPDLGPLVQFANSVRRIEIDAGVVAVAAALVSLIALFFAVIPILSRSGRNLIVDLGSGQRSGLAPKRRRFLNALVITEVALAVILLVGTGLMALSFLRLSETETGFRRDNVVTVSLALPPHLYPDGARKLDFIRRAEEKIEALAEVRKVSWISDLPLSGPGSYLTLTLRNRPPSDSEILFAANALTTADYFQAMGIPLLAGRTFTPSDDFAAPSVVIVSESMAATYWPGENPIGKQLKRGALPRPETPWSTVVGVVGDIKHLSLRGTKEPAFYFPYAQHAENAPDFLYLVVEQDPASEDLGGTLVRLLQEVDPALMIGRIATVEELGQSTVFRHRLMTVLISGAALCALLLALLGIYGVISYTVSQREHEMAIRLAVGAEAADLRFLILRWGLQLALIGLVAGWLGAGLLTRLLESQLYQIGALDPMVYLASGLLLAATALLAAYLPARRATRVDPIEPLRQQ